MLLQEWSDPRWTTTVNGQPTTPVMIAPGYVGVRVAPGKACDRVQVQALPHYPLLIASGVLSLLVLVTWPRRAALLTRSRAAIDAVSSLRAGTDD